MITIYRNMYICTEIIYLKYHNHDKILTIFIWLEGLYFTLRFNEQMYNQI